MKINYLFFILPFCWLTADSQNKAAALRFDGTDDYVHINHHNSLNLGRSAFTIEA